MKLLRHAGMKHIVLANTNVKFYSCALTFCKVVWQQIWGKSVILIPAAPQHKKKIPIPSSDALPTLRNYIRIKWQASWDSCPDNKVYKISHKLHHFHPCTNRTLEKTV